MTETKLKDTNDYNTHLVFTHWDPSGYKPYSNINDFIIEIIWASLQYDCIYLRDVDLVLNSHLCEMFLREESKSILERLLETGFVRIHTMKPEWYPQKIENSPTEKPIAARAEYVEKYSTYGTQKFVPNENQKRFYKKLDSFLLTHRRTAIEEQPDYGIPSVFQKEFLGTICTKSNQNELLEHPYYTGLTYRCLDDFAQYAADPEYAKSKIIESGQEVPEHPDVELRFIRSLGYQCSSLSKYSEYEKKAIQKLIQSIFAKVYCDSINADGRYSDLLPETLIKIENSTQGDDLPLRVETVKGANIKIDHKTFLEALIEARKNTFYMRHPLKSSQESKNLQTIKVEINKASDIFAKHYQNNLPNSQLVRDCEVSLGLLGTGICFVSLFQPIPYKVEAIATGGAMASIAKISEGLRYICRRINSKQISRKIKRAIQVRFVKVPLLTKPKTQ